MTQQFTKLKTLLQELFQLDQPDLDFGLYRVMHAKSAEVSQFLEKDLLPQVQAAFAQYQSADRGELEKELAKAIEQAQALGADPEGLPKVKELRARLASEAVDVTGLEREVYDHLYTFFRRYYSEGDYLAKRVYKPGVYAIPYEGEEVALHWANKDQYYIKSSEYLRNYTFRLRPDDEANSMRVHFRLADAAEGEHGNVKAAEGKDRRFKLAAEQPMVLENGELVIRFTYLPDAKKQADLNAEAEASVLANADAEFADWVTALRASAPTEKAPNRTVLAKHLKGYTARNTFDYFIHKDLGGFLRRELDFYIKNEVMHLDDVENETAPRVEQYLSKIKVVRRIAGKIIDFLAQLEDFQKKLWLKKKFVVEASYCIRLGVIPEEFYPEIAANEAQREEWVALCGIDTSEADLLSAAYSVPLTIEFLKANPTLMVDTRHFYHSFTARLLAAVGDIEESLDGVLFHNDNFQALALMQARYRNSFQCIYIDPPYNAKSSEILYRNDFKHSTWLTLMDDRLSLARHLMAQYPALVVAIDEVEQERLGQLLSMHFPDRVKDCIVINHNPSGQQGDNFSFTHEYAFFVHCAPGRFIAEQTRDNPADWDERNFRDVTGDDSLRTAGRNCFYPIYVRGGQVIGFGDVCADEYHPNVNEVLEDGTIAVFPVDPEGIERKWRFARDTVEAIAHELKVHTLDRRGVVDIKRLKKTFNYKSNWTDAKYSANNHGTQLLNQIIPRAPASYPKSLHTVRDCVHAGLNGNRGGIVADYFAGSGTTGHAVINLNREDGGRRKFVLVEMGDYFDTVLLPRIKKVTFTPEWKDGKPKRLATADEAKRGPRIIKVVRLESYEDALNNLETRRTDEQQLLLSAPEAQGADRLKEQYILRYMLNVETRGSQSLLSIQAFADPTGYTLKVKRPGSDESREVPVDLLETFNWLVGLRVDHIAAPRNFAAAFKRDDDKDLPADAPRRLLLDGRLREDPDGPWWFRSVTGTTPDGRKALVIWRKLTGDAEQDNLVLDTWFTRRGYSAKDSEFDVIWVNGGTNLENLKTPDDRWKVRLIEEDFHRLMFEGTE
jgi:adenine-specific DNA-methyltransferase